jgi:hypothetical protein
MITNNNLAMVSNERKLKQTLGVDKSAAVAEWKAEADQLLVELKETRAKQTHLEREQKDYQKKDNEKASQARQEGFRGQTHSKRRQGGRQGCPQGRAGLGYPGGTHFSSGCNFASSCSFGRKQCAISLCAI